MGWFLWSVIGAISRVSGDLFVCLFFCSPSGPTFMLPFLDIYLSCFVSCITAVNSWKQRHMLYLSARCVQMPVCMLYKRHLTFWNDVVALIWTTWFCYREDFPPLYRSLVVLPSLPEPLLLCTHWSCFVSVCVGEVVLNDRCSVHS